MVFFSQPLRWGEADEFRLHAPWGVEVDPALTRTGSVERSSAFAPNRSQSPAVELVRRHGASGVRLVIWGMYCFSQRSIPPASGLVPKTAPDESG